MEKRWQEEDRKREFLWVHRYLRLHKELLDDLIYQQMHDCYRATLINHYKQDRRFRKYSDEKRGELLDVTADIFNGNSAERVNAYKPLVDELYNSWKESPPNGHCVQLAIRYNEAISYKTTASTPP